MKQTNVRAISIVGSCVTSPARSKSESRGSGMKTNTSVMIDM